jgi:CheY-like chemotaxis protein
MILLIDDSDQERALIRKMLESGGHEVRDAGGGDEGVALFGTLRPDLVICDLMMPHKDGFATVDEMRQLTPDATIIVMSGVWYGKADHDAMAKSLGVAAVIEKPFERAQLLKAVADALAPPPTPKRKAKAAKKKAKAKAKPKAKAAAAKRKPAARRKAAAKRKPPAKRQKARAKRR